MAFGSGTVWSRAILLSRQPPRPSGAPPKLGGESSRTPRPESELPSLNKEGCPKGGVVVSSVGLRESKMYHYRWTQHERGCAPDAVTLADQDHIGDFSVVVQFEFH